MDREAITDGYTPFAAELRRGTFSVPKEGWPAELIGAHVARNNELIAEAAEGVATGESPVYDNAAAVDEDALRAYAEAAGGLPGLADAVESSALRLAEAWAALAGAAVEYPLPVRIIDSGQLVRNGPVPLRDFIEGNASFHLQMHLDQLRELRP